MNSTHEIVKKVCDKLNIQCEDIRGDGISIRIEINGRYYYALHNGPFFNDGYIKNVCDDKEFSYSLLKDSIRFPRYKAYIHYETSVRKGFDVDFRNNKQIVKDISENFDFPLIVKMNKGSVGRNVFKCENKKEVRRAVNTIFTKNTPKDYILLAQEYINIKHEYRVITYNGGVEFVYEKDVSNAKFNGNLSPLHWDGGMARDIEDLAIIEKLEGFCKDVYKYISATIAGLDIVQNVNGDLYFIEINSNPSFAYYIRDCGTRKIEDLFTKILMDKKREVHQTTPPIN